MGNNSAIFKANTNGFMSIGNMDFAAMQNYVSLAGQAVSDRIGTDFVFKNAIAVSGKNIDISNNQFGIGTIVKNGLNVGANNLFIADVSALPTDGTESLLKGDYSFADNAGIYLAGVKASEGMNTYSLFDSNSSGVLGNVHVTSNNRLLDIVLDNSAGGLVANIGLDTDNEIFISVDPSLKQELINYATNPSTNEFLDIMLDDPKKTGLTGAEVAVNIESASKVLVVAGIPQQGISIFTKAADLASSRTYMAPQSKAMTMGSRGSSGRNLSAGDSRNDETQLWIMPMYEHQDAEGLKSGQYVTGYTSDFTGFVLGGDYTMYDLGRSGNNSARFGVSLNMGTGNSESQGDYSPTDNDYDSLGFGFYAGYMWGNFGLSVDMHYSHIQNDVSQDLGLVRLNGENNTSVYGFGVRAEYKLQAKGFDIVPHIGARFSHMKMSSLDMELNGTVNLTEHANQANIWQFPVGFAVTKDFVLDNGFEITPSLDLSVIPVVGDKEIVQEVSFAGVNGVASMRSAIMDDISGRAELGLKMKKDSFFVDLTYAYQGSENMDSHGIQAQIGFTF